MSTVDKNGIISQVVKKLGYLDNVGASGRSNKARLVRKREKAVPKAMQLIRAAEIKKDISPDQLQEKADSTLAPKIRDSAFAATCLVDSFPETDRASFDRIKTFLHAAVSTLEDRNVVGKYPDAFAHEVDKALLYTEILEARLLDIGDKQVDNLRTRIALSNPVFAAKGNITSSLVEDLRIADARSELPGETSGLVRGIAGLLVQVLPEGALNTSLIK